MFLMSQEYSEIGYLLLPSRDMAEIPLKRRKSSIQPTNQWVKNVSSEIEVKESISWGITGWKPSSLWRVCPLAEYPVM